MSEEIGKTTHLTRELMMIQGLLERSGKPNLGDTLGKAVARMVELEKTTEPVIRGEWFDAMADLPPEVEKYIHYLEGIVNAVAHVGVDFGFGPYQVTPELIETARKLTRGKE